MDFLTYIGILKRNINFGTVNSWYLSYEYAAKDFGLYLWILKCYTTHNTRKDIEINSGLLTQLLKYEFNFEIILPEITTIL